MADANLTVASFLRVKRSGMEISMNTANDTPVSQESRIQEERESEEEAAGRKDLLQEDAAAADSLDGDGKQKKTAGKKQRLRGIYCVLLLLCVPLLEYISIECFLEGNIREIGFWYGFKNVLLIFSVNLALVSLLHNLRLAIRISAVLTAVLGTVNYFVDSFRGYGVVYMDFFAVRTAANVAGDYQYTLQARFWLGLLLAALCIVLTFLLKPGKRRYLDRRNMAWGGAGLVLTIAFYIWLGNTFTFWEDVSGLTWDHNIGMSEYGYVLYATANAGEAKVEPPEGYSAEKVDEILSKYGKTSGAYSVMATPSRDVQSPNLIMIMNESFSDLEVLGDISTNMPYLDYFNRLKKNTIRGYVESSVYGGYTANAEFEFLTGCTKAFLPGNPYLQYIDDYLPNLITNLKAQGNYQEAIAFHPYYPSGYNRNRVYPLLGFDRFLSLEDVTAPKLVRKYVGDESDYEMIEKLYEEKEEGTSLCLFNVTMQNHNSYTDTSYEFEEKVTMTAASPQFEVNQYLSLMRMSDKAIQKLIAYFKKEEEPTMIVIFGDHQPHLPDSFYQAVMGKTPDSFTQAENMLKYKVPFLIWANYDIPEQTIENTSINYLSAIMCQAAGLELTDFQRFLLHMYEKLPSVSANGYYDENGRLHNWNSVSDSDSEYKELLWEYEMIQYNYLFDKENCVTEHFQLTEADGAQ